MDSEDNVTRREAAIIGAYTGVILGSWDDVHDYIEELTKRPVLSDELTNPQFVASLRYLAKADLLAIKVEP